MRPEQSERQRVRAIGSASADAGYGHGRPDTAVLRYEHGRPAPRGPVRRIAVPRTTTAPQCRSRASSAPRGAARTMREVTLSIRCSAARLLRVGVK